MKDRGRLRGNWKTPFLFAVKHLECHNDGIQIEFRAESVQDAGPGCRQRQVTLRLRDKDDNLLYEFYGSLKSGFRGTTTAALNDYVGLHGQTDAVELQTGVLPCRRHRRRLRSLRLRHQRAPAMGEVRRACFSEGGTAYTTQDYMGAREKLQYDAVRLHAYIRPAARRPRRCWPSSRNWHSTRTASLPISPATLLPEAAIAS